LEVPSEQQQQPALHPNFRLWLTTIPVDFFPAAVLHKGVRLFLEPPRGLKPTLLSIYSSLPPGYLASCDSCGRGQQWQRLVFVGALLHGLLCERRRFGPLGWNVPYEFSDGDLSCALANMQVRTPYCLGNAQLGHGAWGLLGEGMQAGQHNEGVNGVQQ
jgi:dynein heavy chain